MFAIALTLFALLALSSLSRAATLQQNKEIFARPIITRYSQNNVYITGHDATTVGNALCPYNASYVNGLVYLNASVPILSYVVDDYKTIKGIVRNGDGDQCKGNPDAKFDIEITINQDNGNDMDFNSTEALDQRMRDIHNQFQNDGFWFDFFTSNYSSEQKGLKPNLTAQAVITAHDLNCTVGGNVFQTMQGLPPQTDAISFVDDLASPDFAYGFGVNTSKINDWNALIEGTNTVLLGHLASNPQNGKKKAKDNKGMIPNGNFTSTESCVYNGINSTYVGDKSGEGTSTLISPPFNITRRALYNRYFAGLQQQYGFTYMFPAFYPVCPVKPLTALDALGDTFANSSTLLDVLYQQSKDLPGTFRD